MAMVHRGRRRAVVHHRTRSTEAAVMTEAPAMTAEARAGTGHKRSSRQNRAKYKYHLLVHFVFPFSAFAVTTR
jgi:anti-sigma factor RsiW